MHCLLIICCTIAVKDFEGSVWQTQFCKFHDFGFVIFAGSQSSSHH